MDTLDGIEKLAYQAREEKTPNFDVANQVLQQIKATETETFSFAVFELIYF